MTFSIVVPTLNAANYWNDWITALKNQTLQPDTVLIIDSSSDDNTADLSRAAGFDVRIISRSEFTHGGTRQSGVDYLQQSDVIIFLTQDAIFADTHALANIITGFADPEVSIVYGRQLPRPGAGYIESHARQFNYPEFGRISSLSDIKTIGIRAAFNSNSFAAYRREALMAVGGFPAHVIASEDVYVAVKMLLKNWKIVYCAEARVYHSHNFTFLQEFRRYFDIGVFYARENWLAVELGKHEGEGLRFLKSEWLYLLKVAPYLIPLSVMRTVFKYIGYRLGKLEGFLPVFIKRHISMQKSYWL